MDDSDYGTFERAFERASGAFRRRFKTPQEQADVTRTYFRALERYRLDVCLEALGACVRKLRSFPKIADILAELAPVPANCPPDRRQMTQSEVDEHAQAAEWQYRDEPCPCLACQAAGVSDRALRFVPTVVGDDEEHAFNPRRQRVEVVGHWAHGEELQRWYLARDRCLALWRQAGVRYPHLVGRGLALVAAGEREPGEEG